MENIKDLELKKYAEISNSYDEILLRMKDDGYLIDLKNKNYLIKLRRYIHKINIKTDHMKYLGLKYRSYIWSIPKEVFVDIIDNNYSYADSIRQLKNKYDVFISLFTLKYRIKEENIDIKHFNGLGKIKKINDNDFIEIVKNSKSFKVLSCDS